MCQKRVGRNENKVTRIESFGKPRLGDFQLKPKSKM
jgi:hypothetical protein